MESHEKHALENTLIQLSEQQQIAMKDAVYLGWTFETFKSYEAHTKQIGEIRMKLGLPLLL